jgi:hypothetical protein
MKFISYKKMKKVTSDHVKQHSQATMYIKIVFLILG